MFCVRQPLIIINFPTSANSSLHLPYYLQGTKYPIPLNRISFSKYKLMGLSHPLKQLNRLAMLCSNSSVIYKPSSRRNSPTKMSRGLMASSRILMVLFRVVWPLRLGVPALETMPIILEGLVFHLFSSTNDIKLIVSLSLPNINCIINVSVLCM